MRKLRHSFNMIEVTLALAIISIGLCSVMVLFTSGTKAQKTAVANNNLPDVAEYVISRLRSNVLQLSDATGWKTTASADGFKMPTSSTAAFTEITLSDFGTIAANDGAGLKYNSTKNAYLFRQLSPVSYESDGTTVKEYVADFSAIAQILRRSTSVSTSVYNKAAGGVTSVTLSDADPLAVFDVQISYPADFPDAQREKKIYRVEIYNDLYDRILQ